MAILIPPATATLLPVRLRLSRLCLWVRISLLLGLAGRLRGRVRRRARVPPPWLLPWRLPPCWLPWRIPRRRRAPPLAAAPERSGAARHGFADVTEGARGGFPVAGCPAARCGLSRPGRPLVRRAAAWSTQSFS